MVKRIFLSVFCLIIILSVCVTPFCVSAYEVTGYNISARNGMLVSLDTGEVLYENKIDEKIFPASITKIMTVTLILESEKYSPDAKIALTKSALDTVLGTGSSVSNMKEGEEFTQLDLVYLVLMSSFGDCAYLAAEYYGGSTEAFVDMMNAKAKELGLSGTHYSNPVGLHDERNYTTVRDIYTLTKYALKNETFKKVCESARYRMPATNFSPERTLSTTNFLQDTSTNYYYQYAKGVKTGYTDEAGRCLVSTATCGEYSYICILMGCPVGADRRYEFVDSAYLYRWAFNNFSFKEVASSKEPICEMPVNLSLDTDFVPLYFKESFLTVLPNEADDSTVIVKPHLNSESVDAPVKKGQVLGSADVIYAEKVIGTVELVAGNDIKSSFILVVVDKIKDVLSSVYMKIIFFAVIAAILIFIILCVKLNISKINKRKVKYIPYKERGKTNHEK